MVVPWTPAENQRIASVHCSSPDAIPELPAKQGSLLPIHRADH